MTRSGGPTSPGPASTTPTRAVIAARMTAVNEAWSILSDPVQRRRYDRELGLAGQPGPRVWVAPEPEADAEPELLDDRPMTAARAPGFLPLLPPGLFVFSIAVGCVALVLDAPFVLGAAVMLFLLSCVAVAAVALLTLRGAVRR